MRSLVEVTQWLSKHLLSKSLFLIMVDTPVQQDEAARLEVLNRYEILDTPSEQLFDDFTLLASQICETPISLISLVDDQRQWFKSKVGIDVDQTPRQLAFCAHALENPKELLVVENATLDRRFADNALVTDDPYIRFYAGAPLVTPEGCALGTLCVIDRQPRKLNKQQLAALKTLARQVVTQLEARQNVRLLESAAVELESQRSETQVILDHVPAYVFYKDTKNNILRTNQSVANILGVDLADIEGHPAVEFYPEHADDFYQDDLEVIKSGKPKLGIVEQLETGEEGKRWISTDKIPIFNEQGHVEQLLVIASDITHLKSVEESLRGSQEQLRQANAYLEERVQLQTAELRASQSLYEDLYQNAPDMHVSVSPDDATVMQCNQTLLVETGYTTQEVVGQSVFKLYHPSSLGKAKAAMEKFRTTGRVQNFELTLMRKDGSSIEVSLNVSSTRDDQGKILASRSVWRDITEQKRLEEEAKKQTNQLAHLSRVATINEMTTGLAHELNQPLHAIKNYAEGALMRLRKGAIDPKSLMPILENVVDDADRAAELISSLRRFVKPSGKQTASIAPTELIARVMKILSHEIKQHQVTISVKAEQQLPDITCDSVQIKQVLINLILNASEAMSESPEAERLIDLVVAKTTQHTVRFSVIDRGIGAVDVDRMFDAFYTTKTLGMGMGLPICRTIIEAHGGSIEAQKNEGPGISMSFELPSNPTRMGKCLDTE